MAPRTFVTFNWLEDVQISGEDNSTPPPSGVEIMEALRCELIRFGYDATPVEQHESYGWEFYLTIKDNSIWFMLQYCEPWLIIAKADVSWLKRFLRSKSNEDLVLACCELHRALVGSATDIQWFTRNEFEYNKGRGGHDSPHAA